MSWCTPACARDVIASGRRASRPAPAPHLSRDPAIHLSSTLVTSTEASALANAPVAVRGARLALAPRTDEAALLVRAAGLAAAAAADVEDAVAQTLDMFVVDETCE